MMIELVRRHKSIVFSAVLFCILYSLISIVNHYNFRTYALDLGAYTNALYDYVHFQWNDSSVFKEIPENLLADHFDLYLIVLSPLSLIFGTYTLLIVQIIFLILGGIGVYSYIIASGKTKNIALCGALFFYMFFGVFAAVSFDYHSNVVAATFVPWFFYFIRKERLFKASLFLVLILVAKENMSLWMIFVCIGLAIEFRKIKSVRNYLLVASSFSVLYFITISLFMMPLISNNGEYPHFHYGVLGSNFSEAIVHLISHPIDSFKVLFINHTNDPFGDYIKLELHLLLLLSGLPFLIKKPQYLIMLLPIYFQKLFHDFNTMWGIQDQYSVEFTPIMAIGIFMVIAEFKNNKLKNVSSMTVLVLTFACTIRTMDNTVFISDKTKIRFYQEKHYKKNYDVGIAYHQLSKIPKDAIVSAQSPFIPHLSLRNKIYQFPMVKDAEYIVFSEKELTYPLALKAFNLKIRELKSSGRWIIYSDDAITILKKL